MSRVLFKLVFKQGMYVATFNFKANDSPKTPIRILEDAIHRLKFKSKGGKLKK